MAPRKMVLFASAALAACAAAAEFPAQDLQKHRRTQVIPICQKEKGDCTDNKACNKCLKQGSIPKNPKDAKNCRDIQEWFDAIAFPDSSCDYINGPNPLADYVFCLFDTYSFYAGVNCKGATLGPTAAPTGAPTSAPTMAPSAVAAMPTYNEGEGM